MWRTGIIVAMLIAPHAHGADPAAQRTLYLTDSAPSRPHSATRILQRELYRQALLIAARDELRLATRDQALREWETAPSPEETLDATEKSRERNFQVQAVDGKHEVLQQATLFPRPEKGAALRSRLVGFCETDEELSRTAFVALLQARGFKAEGPPMAPNDGPAPADAEALLGHFESLSQFTILRETHAMIRDQGESPARLGVLVRAYANLAQLTSFHWSAEPKVYCARALLYAERMVHRDPNSATALWHRAYARALAGLPDAALADIEQARKLDPQHDPAWGSDIADFATYDLDGLLRTSAGSHNPLTWFLTYRCAAGTLCQGVIMKTCISARDVLPDCQELIGTMCDWTGPGMLNQLVPMAPQIYARTVDEELQSVSGLKQALVDQFAGAAPSPVDLKDRDAICRGLIAYSDAGRDRDEPSLAALGRMIQETTFAHIQRRADLIGRQWGVDASDYAAEVRPLIAEHPYRQIVECYGAANLPDHGLFHDAIRKEPLVDVTRTQMPFAFLIQIHEPGSPLIGAFYLQMYETLDDREPDLSSAIFYDGLTFRPMRLMADRWPKRLQRISRNAPALIAAAMLGKYQTKEPPAWLEQHATYPMVLLARSEQYKAHKQVAEAAKVLQLYLTISPDQNGYDSLANLYFDAGRQDDWLEVEKSSLDAPAYGLEHVNARIAIAQYYMNKGQYTEAARYADAAARSGAGNALLCDAEVQLHLGNVDKSIDLVLDEAQHYSTSPYCALQLAMHEDPNRLQDCEQAMHAFLNDKQGFMDNGDLWQEGALEMVEHKDAKAADAYRRRYEKNPGTISAVHLALLADRMHDDGARTKWVGELKKLAASPSADDPSKGGVARVFVAAYESPKQTFDVNALEAAMKNVDYGIVQSYRYAAACFLENHQAHQSAIDYLKSHYDFIVDIDMSSIDSPLIDRMLSDEKIDLTKPAAPPAQ